jgi:hypothetical protein
VDQEPPPRERLGRFIREALVSDWRPSRDQWLWALRVVLVLALLPGVLTLVGSPFGVTLWNWLDLLIVPVVLAVGGYLFSRSERQATEAAAERRAQDEALQAYLDQMSNMLVPNQDQPSLYKARPGDSLSSVARARTLSVLPRLDGHRKARVVQFLYESGLAHKSRPASSLTNADLRRAYLVDANLEGVHLEGTNLLETNLEGAEVTQERLDQAQSLEGATMPNGQKYEDWLKSKGGGEDGENSGPS